MGKTLLIVRHAEARQTEAGSRDLERPLTADGIRQSSRLGNYLYKSNTDVSAIICSHAFRAIQTSELIADQLNYDVSKIISNTDLYESSVRIIQNIMAEFTNDWNEVLLVGHNPVLTYFVEFLTGHHFDGMEPGSLVKISSSNSDWKLVANGNASFEYYISPNEFNNIEL